jgi:dolichyl-diphosphooligosaccharide--protein glycosyltransferase
MPRADVRAELEIETNRGRKLTYRVLAQANDEGGFALVVPYATEPSPGTHAISNYRVNSLAMDVSANVTDEDVIKGQEVKVAFPHR